jgi:adenosylmethionine-8-amino-7-oxononanoate aminotransferase
VQVVIVDTLDLHGRDFTTGPRISTPFGNTLLRRAFYQAFEPVVYLTPAFTIAEGELATLTAAVRRVLTERA